MKRASAVAVLALLAGSRTLASPTTPSAPVDTLMLKALSAPATVSYTGVVEVVRVGENDADASIYRIEHRAPNFTKRTYSTPSALSGAAIVSRGDTDFSIDPKHRRIVQTRNDAIGDRAALNDNFALLRANYLASTRTGEDLNGRQTIDVALTNRYSGRLTMLVRIDQRSKLVLDKQEYAPDGALVSEMRFEEVQYPNALPQSDFALPKDYAMVQGATFSEPSVSPDQVARSAGFATREPKTLPEGFSPVEGNMITFKGVRTLHLLYSDGLRTLSLFENPDTSALKMTRLHPEPTTVGGREAQYAVDGSMTLLTWTDETLRYALVGEFPLAELQRIAASIGP